MLATTVTMGHYQHPTFLGKTVEEVALCIEAEVK